jgi:hypothetical protein
MNLVRTQVSIVVAALLSFVVTAQVSKTDGPLVKTDGFNIYSFIGSDNTGFYVCRAVDEDFVVQKYDNKTLKVLWETKLTNPNPKVAVLPWKERGDRVGFLKGNKIHVLMFAGNKSEKKALLVDRVLSLDGKILENMKELCSFEVEFANITYLSHQAKHFISFSPDSSKLLCMMDGHLYTGGGSVTQYRASVVDLKIMQGNEIPIGFNYDGKGVFIRKPEISNEGIIAYPYIAFGPNREYMKPGIAIYQPKTKSVKTMELNPNGAGELGVENIGLRFTSNNKLQIAGMMTDSKTNKAVKKANSAFYFAQMDVSSEKLEYEYFKYMPDAWRDKYEPEKYDEKVGESLCNRCIPRGHVTFIPSESGCYVSVVNDYGNIMKMGFEVQYNVVQDGILGKVGPTGKIEWVRVLPMNLKTSEGVLGVMNGFYYNKKLYIVFNEHKSNVKKIDLNAIETSKKTEDAPREYGSMINTVLYAYSADGGIQRTILQENEKIGFFSTGRSVWLDKNKALLFFTGTSKEYFSVLNLDKG